jgi:hypothetical protein
MLRLFRCQDEFHEHGRHDDHGGCGHQRAFDHPLTLSRHDTDDRNHVGLQLPGIEAVAGFECVVQVHQAAEGLAGTGILPQNGLQRGNLLVGEVAVEKRENP